MAGDESGTTLGQPHLSKQDLSSLVSHDTVDFSALCTSYQCRDPLNRPNERLNKVLVAGFAVPVPARGGRPGDACAARIFVREFQQHLGFKLMLFELSQSRTLSASFSASIMFLETRLGEVLALVVKRFLHSHDFTNAPHNNHPFNKYVPIESGVIVLSPGLILPVPW